MKRHIQFIAMLCLVSLLAAAGAGCSSNSPALPEAPTEVVPVAGLATPVPTLSPGASSTAKPAQATEDQKVSVVLYYQDESGYVVPVMRQIPFTAGIAKAALAKLVASDEDQQALAARGVSAPLPEGRTFDLDIADGIATVDVQLNGAKLETSQDEACMIAAVVNTLMEFDTVTQVKMLVDSQKVSKMPQGTVIEDVYTQKLENTDPMGLPSSANSQMQLYFANQTGSFLVPVKRITTGEINALTTAKAMADPGATGLLVSLLPPNCEVLSVEVSEDGIATVDLSEEFLTLSALPANEQMAIRGLDLALVGVQGIKEVKITVEGAPYEPVAETLGTGDATTYLNTMP